MDILNFTKEKVEIQLDLDVEWVFSQNLLQCQGAKRREPQWSSRYKRTTPFVSTDQTTDKRTLTSQALKYHRSNKTDLQISHKTFKK